MKLPACLTRKYWSALWAVWFPGKAHVLNADSEAELAWFLPRASAKFSPGVDVMEVNVWTEGENKCGEHCWHRLPSKSAHLAALGAKNVDEHSDYHCCRCTHGLCHTGAITSWLSRHPLTKFHQKVGR